MARIEVHMPQMGESIAEGTVSKWLKKVGEPVERDEPILEISTDKVDAEIPAPQAGTLLEIVVGEGETVEVGTVIAYIDTEGTAGAAAPRAEEEAPEAEQVDEEVAEKPSAAEATATQEARASSAGAPAAAPPPREETRAPEPPRAAPMPGPEAPDEAQRQRATPVVRRMAEEHGIDLTELEGHGSGHAGRVTKRDLLEYLEGGPAETGTEEPPRAPAAAGAVPARPAAPAAPPPQPVSDLWKAFYGQVHHPEFPVREGDEVETMDKVRRLTAEHMVLAKRIAPHVHSFIEIDFTRVDKLRRDNRTRWDEQGVRVSFTAIVAWAVSRVLREFPMLNATASGNNIIFRGRVNLGIAVDLNPGLIVPVIHDADDLSLVGIGKKVVDLAERARARKLGPEEIQGATFSITNPGVLGTLVGMPIIPKGTSGILGTGSIEKRVAVVTDPETGLDSITIRKTSIFSLGYDHRIVDGADAARFLAHLKKMLEEFPDDA